MRRPTQSGRAQRTPVRPRDRWRRSSSADHPAHREERVGPNVTEVPAVGALRLYGAAPAAAMITTTRRDAMLHHDFPQRRRIPGRALRIVIESDRLAAMSMEPLRLGGVDVTVCSGPR